MRQGDIRVKKINSLPSGAIKSKTKTLAYGEISGHHHTLVPIENAKVQVYKVLDKLFFEVKNGKATLMHTDQKRLEQSNVWKDIRSINVRIDKGQDFHRPITLDAGVYEVETEKEYNPFVKEITTVID